VALGKVRDTDSVNAIVIGVEDSHRLVRLAAAFAAYRCGMEGAARVLARTLTDSPDETLRAEAASLIGRLEEPRAKRWLQAALRVPANQRSTRVTLQIHAALAKLGVEQSVQELITYSQGNAAIRTEALLLLAQLRAPAAYDMFNYRLYSRNEDYDETRLIAARGLGALGSNEGLEFALQALAFTDPNPRASAEEPDRTFTIRSLAAHALAAIGDPRALAPLRDLASTTNDRRLQVAACYAICEIVQRRAGS
jgi:HEAT repeat protein